MISKLLRLDTSKKSLKFLHDRILVDHYRGLQIFQHNRYTYDQVLEMLKIFKKLVGAEKMKIRTTDLKRRPINKLDESLYAEYVNQVEKKFGKGTQDSIRKNLFVDFHRMGLINRYDKYEKVTDPYAKETIEYVSLTKLSFDLIDDKNNNLEKRMIFSRALDNMLKGLATDFFNIIANLNYLTEYEYTFFVSFLRHSLNGKYIGIEDVIFYINDFRSLSKFQIEKVIELVKNYCDPENFSGNKKNKRDFHNWINETRQVFMLLDMTAYYQYNKFDKKMEFMVSSNHVFTTKDDVTKLKRSMIEKKQYFIVHNIVKEKGFELHHIVPLMWAKNITQFFLLDKWENMIYIDGGKHSLITQSGNKHVKLSFSNYNQNIVLTDLFEEKLVLEDKKSVAYNYDLKKVMLDKNNELLK